MVVILAERAADERRADAGQRLDLIVAGVHVCDDLVGGEGIIMIMRVGVVHELIAAVHDGLGLFGILIRPIAHHKKCTGDAVFLEHVEYPLRVVRAPRGVKGDGADLLVALDAIDGQLPRGRRRADGGGIIDGGKHRDRDEPRCGERQPFASEHQKTRGSFLLFRLPAVKMKKHQHILPNSLGRGYADAFHIMQGDRLYSMPASVWASATYWSMRPCSCISAIFSFR